MIRRAEWLVHLPVQRMLIWVVDFNCVFIMNQIWCVFFTSPLLHGTELGISGACCYLHKKLPEVFSCNEETWIYHPLLKNDKLEQWPGFLGHNGSAATTWKRVRTSRSSWEADKRTAPPAGQQAIRKCGFELTCPATVRTCSHKPASMLLFVVYTTCTYKCVSLCAGSSTPPTGHHQLSGAFFFFEAVCSKHVVDNENMKPS